MININHKKPWGWDWGYFLLRLICPMSAESVLISWQKTYSLKKTLYRAFNENVKSKGILQFHKKKNSNVVLWLYWTFPMDIVLFCVSFVYCILFPMDPMESDGLSSLTSAWSHFFPSLPPDWSHSPLPLPVLRHPDLQRPPCHHY